MVFPRLRRYMAVSPTRVCDTRSGNPSHLTGIPSQCNGPEKAMGAPPLGTLTVQLSGTGMQVPVNATAVVANVTALKTSRAVAAAFCRSMRLGRGRVPPGPSNINVNAGATVNNQVTAGIGLVSGLNPSLNQLKRRHPTRTRPRRLEAFTTQTDTVDVLVDVQGYYVATFSGGSTYMPIPPVRICKHGRAQIPGTASAKVEQWTDRGQGGTLAVRVTLNGSSVPAGASAIVADVTAISPRSATTFLTTYANGSKYVPSTSNLNAAAGTVVNKEVTIPIEISNTWSLTFTNQWGTTNVTVDVEGYFAGSSNSNFVPDSPSGSAIPGRGSGRVCQSLQPVQRQERSVRPAP